MRVEPCEGIVIAEAARHGGLDTTVARAGDNDFVSTLFLLIRHGQTDMIGKRITGRMPGVSINKEGEEQARRLVRLQADAIFSSPLERAIQTATPLAEHLGLRIQIDESFSEVDFGTWSGKTIPELEALADWKLYMQFRSSFRVPGGELMLEVQRRVVDALARLATQYPEKTVAVFSHADVIKAAVLHYAGAPLDLIDRIEIYPASLSRIRLFDWGPKISAVNERCL
jgi:probable phosphoglycerate mutase